METIWKYNLDIAGEQTIEMPWGAKPLYVGEQDGRLCLWAVVDTGNSCEGYKILIYGTGHPLSSGRNRHIGTVQMSDGLVWHVYNESRYAEENSKFIGAELI